MAIMLNWSSAFFVFVPLLAINVQKSIAGPFTTIKSTIPAQTSTISRPSIADVPLEFPKHDQNVTFINNETMRDSFVRHDSEVPDLNAKIRQPESPSSDASSDESESEGDDVKTKTELVQNGENTEDQILIEKMANKTVKWNPRDEHYPLFRGQIAAVLAGTFLMVSVVAYIALFAWRRYLERLYGSREMLVNEDDFIVRDDDLKHFSI